MSERGPPRRKPPDDAGERGDETGPPVGNWPACTSTARAVASADDDTRCELADVWVMPWMAVPPFAGAVESRADGEAGLGTLGGGGTTTACTVDCAPVNNPVSLNRLGSRAGDVRWCDGSMGDLPRVAGTPWPSAIAAALVATAASSSASAIRVT